VKAVVRRGPRKLSRRVATACWSVAGFFSLGYFPTAMAKGPVISMTAAACLIIPFGVRSASFRQALLRGLGLGLTAGVGVWSALSYQGKLPREFSNLAMIYIPATAAMCVAVSALFCHAARKRRSLMARGWK